MKIKEAAEYRVVARDVRPDTRNRIALGKVLKDYEDVSFNVLVDERGRIMLEPQVSIPAHEAWLFRNEEAIASVRRGLDDVRQRKVKKLGSFAKFAADDES